MTVNHLWPKSPKPSGVASRYEALRMTHHSLEEKLAQEMKRPLPDSVRVSRLKRRKLAVKDEIASIERLFDALGARQHDTLGAPTAA